MSMNIPVTGCRARSVSSSSRRTGVVFSQSSPATASACATVTITNPQAGAAIAMARPATAGPMACMKTGRSIPSTPFAASRSSAGRIDGSRAEYAG